MTRPSLAAAAIAVMLALAGCAGMRTVDSDVNSYSQWPAERRAAGYAFERLPSQQANPQQQDELENAARDALSKAGFTEAADAASSEVTVQLSARVTRQDSPYWDYPYAWRSGLWAGRGGPGWFWGPGLWMHADPPRYEREVAVLIRDRKTGQALYESRARNDSNTSGNMHTLAAMFEAALKDFPQTAVNPRRISVPLAAQ